MKDRRTSTRDDLLMELVSAECELARHVVPDVLGQMVRQAVTDRADLLKENDRLRQQLRRYEDGLRPDGVSKIDPNR